MAKKNIVLDIDLTLAYTSEESIDKLKEYKLMTNPDLYSIRKRLYRLDISDMDGIRGSGDNYVSFGFLRPHLDIFLKFIFENFGIVAVWSAGRPKYVKSMIPVIFGDLYFPQLIYTFDECQQPSTKELKVLLEEDVARKNGMTLNNTFVVDDYDKTFEKNPYNGILIPQYTPNLIDDSDKALYELMTWFKKDGILNCDDITKLNKDPQLIFNIKS